MVDYSERRPIKGFPGYEVDGLGNVYSVDRTTRCVYKNGKVLVRSLKGTKLRPGLDIHGYYMVYIKSESGKYKTRQVHRLVAEAFLPNPNGLPVVNHIDEIRTNNRVDNLEWCTQHYNLMYGTAETRRRANLKGRIPHNRIPVWAKREEEPEWALYPSLTHAAEALGVGLDGAWHVYHGLRKSTRGCVFKKVDNDGEEK